MRRLLLPLILSALICATLASTTYAPCDFPDFEEQLDNATLPITYGQVEVAIPISTLWGFFSQPQYWPLWNAQFNATFFNELSLCGQVQAMYTTFPNVSLPPLAYTTPIVEYSVTDTNITLGYAYCINDSTTNSMILFGKHRFNLVAVSDTVTSFSSWETSIGYVVEKYTAQWQHANHLAMLEAIVGVECLEEVYTANGSLDPTAVGAACQHYYP